MRKVPSQARTLDNEDVPQSGLNSSLSIVNIAVESQTNVRPKMTSDSHDLLLAGEAALRNKDIDKLEPTDLVDGRSLMGSRGGAEGSKAADNPLDARSEIKDGAI